MSIADELDFDEREHGLGYTVVGTYEPGEGIDFDGINDGDDVSLKLDGECISLKNVSYDEDKEVYWGVISGFSPSVGICFGDLSLNEEISFREEHVFTVSRND